MGKAKTVKKETLDVVWFNRLKGYGEGIMSSGNFVFIHYTAFKSFEKHLKKGYRYDAQPIPVWAEVGEKLKAEIVEEEGRLVAYSVDR